jgi:hypothetical protein
LRHLKGKGDPSVAIVGSRSVKATDKGGARGYDGGKKINGRKRHILVDFQGGILANIISPASGPDAIF